MAKDDRNQGRVYRLVAARAKLLDRLGAHPDHDRAPRWKAKIAEYEESLRNFHKVGQEARPTGRTAITIAGPLDGRVIADTAPGGGAMVGTRRPRNRFPVS